MIRAVCSHIYKTLVFAAVPFYVVFVLFFLVIFVNGFIIVILFWVFRIFFFKPGIETLDIRANGANGS